LSQGQFIALFRVRRCKGLATSVPNGTELTAFSSVLRLIASALSCPGNASARSFLEVSGSVLSGLEGGTLSSTVVVHVGLPSPRYEVASVGLGRYSAGVRLEFGTLSFTVGVHVDIPVPFFEGTPVLLGGCSASSRFGCLGFGFGLCLVSGLSLLLSSAFRFLGFLTQFHVIFKVHPFASFLLQRFFFFCLGIYSSFFFIVSCHLFFSCKIQPLFQGILTDRFSFFEFFHRLRVSGPYMRRFAHKSRFGSWFFRNTGLTTNIIAFWSWRPRHVPIVCSIADREDFTVASRVC
jgi:hypothetical protein